MARKPEATFRVGACSASVFVNQIESDSGKRCLRSVTVQRSYKDNGDWKYTDSFGLGDLPQAIRVLELAQQHVEEQEATVSG